jgi:hypothetical protein
MQLPKPTETKSVHLKAYVEPSLSEQIEAFRKRFHHESTSAAIRQLILQGLQDQWLTDFVAAAKE